MSTLFERVEPRRLVAKEGSLEGEIVASELSRLRADIVSARQSAVIHVRLGFSEDFQRRVLIAGRIWAHLALQCQRCLGPAEWPVDIAIHAMAVTSEDAAESVPRDLEPVILEPEGLLPATLVEDELLLDMPVAPRCTEPHCTEQYEVQPPTDKTRTDDPFSVLKELKRGQ